jgi:hypothetical protein
MNWRVALLASTVVVVLCLFAAVGMLVFKPTSVLSAEGTQLGSSLSRETNSTGGACTLQKGHDWYWCGVEVDAGSGFGASFRLTADENGCWKAWRSRSRGSVNARLS